MNSLTFPQALFLLGRDDATGKPIGNNNRYIQPAGALAHLAQMDRISLRHGHKAIVDVVSTAPTGSPYLDTLLARIAASSRPRTMQHWVTKFASMRGRIRMIGQELVAKGIVEEVPAKYLWLFPVTRWPLRRNGLKLKLISDMEKVLFNDMATPDEWTGTLIGLANSGHLLKRTFDRARLRTHKAHIKRLLKGDWPTTDVTRKAIQAATSAAAAAAAATAVAIAAGSG